jgi:predicted permease
MLLVGAGLLLRSFLHVLQVDLGFEPSRAAAINAAYDDSAPTGQASSEKRRAIFQQMIERISRVPGVEAAGIVDYLPLGQNRAWGTPFPKGVQPPDKLPAGPLVYVVSPGYLRAMGTRIRGRDFTWDDGLKSERVIMVSESYARFMASYAHWPNGDAVGQVLVNGAGQPAGRVIAVVDDVHEESTEGSAGWQVYYSAVQQSPNGAELVVHSRLSPSTLGPSVLTALRDLNPSQPAAEFRPVQSIVDHANSPRRFFLLLVAVFAVLGLLLAALGIYGVVSYSVTRQTQEIGIRMALGASAGRVQAQILTASLRLVIAGIAIGCCASIAGARLISALLYGTSPWNAATYTAVSAMLLVVAAVAGYVPAWRASRISPMVALRTN